MRSALIMLASAFVLSLFVLAQQIVQPIRFEDVAERAGVHFITENSPTPERHQPETMPAGVALFDYDGDGLLDIYLVNGADMPSLVKTGPKFYNRLFRNNGNGTFTDVTEHAGVAGTGYGMGAAVGDYDNDGRPDLFVANVNGNQLFHNNGDGTFTDVTIRAGVSGATHNGRKMWSIAAGWFDYNRDGFLDLFVVNYCDWDPRYEPICTGINGRGYCHPDSFPRSRTLFIATMATAPSPTSRRKQVSRRLRAGGWALHLQTMTMTDGPTSLSPTIIARISFSTISTESDSRRLACRPAWRTTTMAMPSPAWVSISAM